MTAQSSIIERAASRPSRARGLKQSDWYQARWPINVAPFAGAWIETRAHHQVMHNRGVAPFAGAWIETSALSARIVIGWPSRPSRARGLKLYRVVLLAVWRRSRPSRARGLKPMITNQS